MTRGIDNMAGKGIQQEAWVDIQTTQNINFWKSLNISVAHDKYV